MATARKKQIVKDLTGLFKESQVLIFTDYRGLSVSDITNLRRQLRDKGVEFHVAKNTLSTLAANRTGLEAMNDMLDGPTAIAFVGDDIPGAAKVLGDFVRTSRILQIRGGLAGRSVLSAEQVADLTKILRREEYVAKMLGSMQSPIASVMNVLNGTIRGFMNVMQARIDQMKEGGDTSGAEASQSSEAAASDGTTDGGASEASSLAATGGETAEAASSQADASGEATEAATPQAATEAETTTSDAAASATTEAAAPETSTETTTGTEGEVPA